jgi:hypothetical protein
VPANTVNRFQVDAILCDSAVTAEGKLYIQGGGWNNLNPQSYPARVARVGLGIVVTVPYSATNQNHSLRITLMDDDGNHMTIGGEIGPDGDKRQAKEIQAQFIMGRPPTLAPGDAQVAALALNIDGMEIAAPGAYAFVLAVDGTEEKRLVFRAMPPQGQIFAG